MGFSKRQMHLAQTSALHGLLAVRRVPNTEDASGGLGQSGMCTVDVCMGVMMFLSAFDTCYEVNSICHFIQLYIFNNVTCLFMFYFFRTPFIFESCSTSSFMLTDTEL